MDHHSCEKLTESVEEVALRVGFLDAVSVLGKSCLQAVVDRLRQVVVECVEEFLLRRLGNTNILNKGVRDIVSSHAIEQELVMSLILRFVLCPFEIGADEVPKGVADQRIEVLHADNAHELILHLGFALAERHTGRDVFL